MLYAACVIAGIVVGFLIACRMFCAMQDDFVASLTTPPKEK